MATTNYSWALPTVGGSENTWGTSLNSNWAALDTLLGGTDATEFAILNGATVTTAELNILDGVTSTTAEINLLDGVTATTVEINHLSGVTSGLQAQIDTKAAAASLGTFSAEDTVDYIRSQGTWNGGTSIVESVISPSKLKGVFDHNINAEVSAAQTIASSTTFTFTPTFTPNRADVYLECTSAINGYSVGDKVQLGGDGGHENIRGVAVVISGGSVKVRVGDALRLLSFSANSVFFATSANFDLYIKAYRQ